LIGKTVIPKAELERIRVGIWEIYKREGRLANVTLQILPAAMPEGGSTVQARVIEMRLRKLEVVSGAGASIPSESIDRITRQFRAQLNEGEVLDLNRLDDLLKRRLFMRDLGLSVSVDPVDAGHVDLKLLATANAKSPVAAVLQYDNAGAWTFGRDRLTGGVVLADTARPGDRIEALALKSEGQTYARMGYELPWISAGSRASVSATAFDYRAQDQAATNPHGRSMQLGAGLERPLFLGESTTWIMRADYAYKRQQDRVLEANTLTGDKSVQAVKLRLNMGQAIGQRHSMDAATSVTAGDLDLSRVPSALEQDQAGPQTNGRFLKLEWNAGWLSRLDAQRPVDFRVQARGQVSTKNLDSSENLVLGGPSGLRAFGAGEAAGSQGYAVTAEIGVRPTDTMRLSAFYDFGHISRFKRPYLSNDPVPEEYSLRDVGIAWSGYRGSFEYSLAYARQIGANPGLTAAGLDSDNTTQRFRFMASLSYRY
jgi:hemolysin activation/secretion protein